MNEQSPVPVVYFSEQNNIPLAAVLSGTAYVHPKALFANNI
jgi:hypothetical protein